VKLKLCDLKANPFRHLARYPLDERKIEALMGSINQTTFWDNLMARPATNGQYEIAYGHNRLEALRRLKVKEIDIPVRDLSDDDMARIMANENMEEWSHSSKIEQETIRTVVEGFAAGKLHLPSPTRRDGKQIRLAPSFTICNDKDSSRSSCGYNLDTLREYLGWPAHKIEAALGALEMIESSVADESVFEDLTTKQAQVVTQQANRVFKETGDKKLAGNIAKELAGGMKKATTGTRTDGGKAKLQDVTIHNAKRVTDEMLGKHTRKTAPPKTLPDINGFAHDIAHELLKTIDQQFGGRLDAVIEHAEHLSVDAREDLTKELMRAAKRLREAAESLNRAKPAPAQQDPLRLN
jgi:hypothetical protein